MIAALLIVGFSSLFPTLAPNIAPLAVGIVGLLCSSDSRRLLLANPAWAQRSSP